MNYHLTQKNDFNNLIAQANMTQSDTSRDRANSIIEWLRNYASDRINSRLIDERRCIPPYIVLDFGNQGILGMQVPEQYGGLALNTYDAMRVIEQIAGIDITLATFVTINSFLGIRHFRRCLLNFLFLNRFPTQQLKLHGSKLFPRPSKEFGLKVRMSWVPFCAVACDCLY